MFSYILLNEKFVFCFILYHYILSYAKNLAQYINLGYKISIFLLMYILFTNVKMYIIHKCIYII